MKLHPKVEPVLNKLLELFESGDVPKAVATATFPPFDVPSNAWSLTNRILMALHGSSDCRGYDQWRQVNRYVKKGSKAVHILAPWLANKRNKEEDDDDQPRHISKVLRGFLAVPVFRVEDTDGEALDYQSLELPQLPLLDVAKAWGVDVAAVAYQGGWLGYFRPDTNEIRLATPEQKTFFHELSHKAHQLITGKLQPGQHWHQEIVAELSAQALCHIVGTDPKRTVGNTYDYICHYAQKAGKEPIQAILSVIRDVEKVMAAILVESSVQTPFLPAPSR